ncbi:thermophilic serine proteinase [Kordia sp. SMS9]|uniref:S8 family serine peptidase n=1 Tax=Kordia sp. SMS9 TaxID=2282170 RepID=UPI000E0D2FA8|nr:S8 family serine peptidase [Kordia sp. SMS9]AXG69829.1 thermophilic serine proteinase [Kordia sp. SMS9]
MNNSSNIITMLPGIEALWKNTKGDPTIKIAVLDGPVDLQHPTLKETHIRSLDVPTRKNVRSTHGTFVSSLIFANHNSGILGIAPNCSGLVKSIYQEDENGKLLSSSQSDIEQGIRMALEHDADIINISGGEKLNKGDNIISSLAAALELCEKKGVLVIAATGNEGNNSIHVPANYPTVLAVGSIKPDGVASNFSNWSTLFPEKGLVAPGENIIGAIPSGDNQKAIANGTSFSTALVSGIAGLLASLQKKKGMPKDLLAIRQILLNSVTPCTVDENINCDPIMVGRLHIGNAIQHILKAGIKPQNFLTLNNTNMQNEPEVMPLSANNDQTDAVIPQEASTPVAEVTPSETAMPVATPTVTTAATAEVAPSACGCAGNVTPSQAPTMYNPAINPGGYPTFRNTQLVNAIGQPSYDFGTQNNLDTFRALMKTWYDNLPKELQDELTDSPHDHKAMAAFLLFKEGGSYQNIFMSSQLIWLLNINSTPIYSISPRLSTFSDPIYLFMAQFLGDNTEINHDKYSQHTANLRTSEISLDEIFGKEEEEEKSKKKPDVMRMVLPGFVSGESKLMNGNYVEAVTPVAYGLRDWTLEALLKSMEINNSEFKEQLISVLNRLYVTTLNRGKTPEDRALNYSLYNILELSDIVKEATKKKLQLSSHRVLPSKIERQNSIVREVQLTFFDPENTNKASTTYSMQVDVSGVTPIIIGDREEWYAPVSVTIAS